MRIPSPEAVNLPNEEDEFPDPSTFQGKGNIIYAGTPPIRPATLPAKEEE